MVISQFANKTGNHAHEEKGGILYDEKNYL